MNTLEIPKPKIQISNKPQVPSSSGSIGFLHCFLAGHFARTTHHESVS